jgi:hypothetical protein
MGDNMKNVSRPEPILTFTKFFWVCFFGLILFFSQYFSSVQNLSQDLILPNKNVISCAEYQASNELQNIYVLVKNWCLKFDSDTDAFNPVTSKHSAIFSEIKSIQNLSHRHFKNSPITIRMVSLVLQV